MAARLELLEDNHGEEVELTRGGGGETIASLTYYPITPSPHHPITDTCASPASTTKFCPVMPSLSSLAKNSVGRAT